MAAGFAAARRYLPGHAGAAVGPHHHLAALTLCPGIGLEHGAGRHRGALRIHHPRVGAVQVAAHQDAAASLGAAGVHHCAAGQRDVPAQHLHLTTMCPDGRGAAARLQPRLGLGLEHHLAAFHTECAGLDLAGLAQAAGEHADSATRQTAQVDRLVGGCLHLETDAHQAGAGELQLAPCGQDDIAALAADGAGVEHRGRHQHHVAATAAEAAVVLDDAALAREAQLAAGKVAVADVQRRSQEALGVHAAAFSKDHAVGIDQEHLAVGADAAQDAGRVGPGDAVEHRAVGAALVEAGALALAHGKRLPVEDGAGRIGDGHLRALALDRGTATDHLRAHRVGLRRASQHGGDGQRQAAQGQPRPPVGLRRTRRARRRRGPTRQATGRLRGGHQHAQTAVHHQTEAVRIHGSSTRVSAILGATGHGGASRCHRRRCTAQTAVYRGGVTFALVATERGRPARLTLNGVQMLR